MENIEFTEELIKTLYDRAYEYFIIRHNVKVDRIVLEGSQVIGEEVSYRCGDRDVEEYYASIEELNNTDYDKLREARLEDERIEKERLAEERRKREKAEKERKERMEFFEYMRLKQKFDTK